MTDHPITFTAPMIRALLDGRKTQTRRPIKPSNSLFNGGRWTALHKAQTWDWNAAWVDPGPSPAGNSGPYLHLPWQDGPDADTFRDTSHRVYPVIQPGDRLWVKETWAHDAPVPVQYKAGPHVGDDALGVRWKPPMFMPRWASRITLTVTDVRVQRVQDISEADCYAEGIDDFGRGTAMLHLADGSTYGMPRACYLVLWENIHGRDSWQGNPWVWAYSFTVDARNIDTGAIE